MNGLKIVVQEHLKNGENIFNMAVKDMRKQYSGTFLGYFWSLLKDLIFVFAYWFAIYIGLKGGGKVGYPYMAWLVVGLYGWFFIRDTFAPGAKAIRQNRYLVTKMVYPVSTIPTFKIISSFLSNLLFLPVVIITLILCGVDIKLQFIQLLYYQVAAICLMVGISLFTSALVVVSRDFEMLINSIVFMLFWFTPILFPASNLTGKLAVVMKLNPFYYIVEGYRATFLYGQWFWERPALMLYYWIFVLSMIFLGSFVHGRLRNQFVDIL